MIRVDEAIEIVLSTARPLGEMPVALTGSTGYVLSETVHADIDFPDFDRAMMDGYAVKASDSGEGKILAVDGVIAAGQRWSDPVPDGHAVKIMTGAPIPPGTDAVIEIELTSEAGEGKVKLESRVEAGRNIACRGEEAKRGAVLVPEGAVIDSAIASVLAMAGRIRVQVYRVPLIGILATGSELIDPSEHPAAAGQVRDSNTYGLNAQCLIWRGIPLRLGFAGDDRDRLEAAIERAMAYDVLILTGGVSVGDFDCVPDILAALGVEIKFHRVAMKPGKPVLFGKRGSTWVFGLPGNPVAAFLGFELFIGPLIRRLSGEAEYRTTWFDGVAAGDFRVGSDRTFFSASRVVYEDGIWKAFPVESRGSADIFSVVGANAFVRFEEGRYAVPAGEKVRFFFQRGKQYGTER